VLGYKDQTLIQTFTGEKLFAHCVYHDIITEDDRALQYLKPTLGRACSNEVED